MDRITGRHTYQQRATTPQKILAKLRDSKYRWCCVCLWWPLSSLARIICCFSVSWRSTLKKTVFNLVNHWGWSTWLFYLVFRRKIYARSTLKYHLKYFVFLSGSAFSCLWRGFSHGFSSLLARVSVGPNNSPLNVAEALLLCLAVWILPGFHHSFKSLFGFLRSPSSFSNDDCTLFFILHENAMNVCRNAY